MAGGPAPRSPRGIFQAKNKGAQRQTEGMGRDGKMGL